MEKGYFRVEGTIIVKVPSAEYNLLLKLYRSEKKIEGLMKDFGYNGAVRVINMQLVEQSGQIIATFDLVSV